MSGNPVVEFSGVTVRFDEKPVLHNLNFKLHNGEFVYLVGRTGAGKSSFLKLIYRDILPEYGTVQVADFRVNEMKEKKIPYLRRSLGIVFQDFQLLPDRNVYDNIAFALEVTGNRRRFIKQRVMEVLSMVELGHKKNSMPDELSGGEQQRIVIARSLVNEPRIMLADEPTGNLDPEASQSIMDLLRQINNRGMAVLMVTHNYDVVKQYRSRTIRLKDGQIQEVEVL